MKGSKKVLDYLNQALKHELTASSQYWLHYRLLDDWGYGKMASKWREEAVEEMGHADSLIVRIIFLEGHPNLQTLNPLKIGQSVREILDADLEAEYDARALYKEARDVCKDEGDYVSMELFEKLMTDEEDHIDFLETQIELYDKLGEQNYGLLNASSVDAE